MRGSIIVWSLMASAPALLLGVLGIVGRTQITTWEFEAYSHQQNRDILAYASPVKQAASLAQFKSLSPEHGLKLQKVTDLWLRLRAEGQLTDVLPGSMEDQGSEGIKLQILEARQILLNQTNHFAYEQRHAGDLAGSSLSVARGVALADIFKYSGIAALQQSSLAQASGMRNLMEAAPRLSREEMAQVVFYVKRAYRPDQPILPLAEEISHLSIRQTMKRGKSLSDMSRVFQVSSLEQMTEGSLRERLGEEKSYQDCGLEIAMANTMTAALRAEARVQEVIAEFLRTYEF